MSVSQSGFTAARHGLEGTGEFRARHLQFMPVGPREFAEKEKSCRSQLDDHSAAVRFILSARHGSQRLEPVYQFHSAVMLQSQPASQFADGGVLSLGEPPNGQQQLVLLRLKT